MLVVSQGAQPRCTRFTNTLCIVNMSRNRGDASAMGTQRNMAPCGLASQASSPATSALLCTWATARYHVTEHATVYLPIFDINTFCTNFVFAWKPVAIPLDLGSGRRTSIYLLSPHSRLCRQTCVFDADIDRIPSVSREYVHRRRIFPINDSKVGGPRVAPSPAQLLAGYQVTVVSHQAWSVLPGVSV